MLEIAERFTQLILVLENVFFLHLESQSSRYTVAIICNVYLFCSIYLIVPQICPFTFPLVLKTSECDVPNSILLENDHFDILNHNLWDTAIICSVYMIGAFDILVPRNCFFGVPQVLESMERYTLYDFLFVNNYLPSLIRCFNLFVIYLLFAILMCALSTVNECLQTNNYNYIQNHNICLWAIICNVQMFIVL